MSDLRQRLDLLMRQKGIMTGDQWVQRKAEIDARRAAGDFEIDRVLPGEVHGDGDFGFYLVRNVYPPEFQQGAAPLGAALECGGETIALSACDDELVDFDARRTLFVDTETIGLAGGTGTIAFLIGAGYFQGDDFVVDQCFMRDYDDEEPMLGYLGERFRDHDCVVGYNSKSFDVPLMRTRFIQNRVPFALDAVMHYDLVHAARRLWKARLRDCSLGNVERHILGFERTGDVPSHQIPQRYFDYLRSRDARPLQPVFYHHRNDIVSLAALTGLIAARLAREDGGADNAHDRLSLVRLHTRQKQWEKAADAARRYLEAHDDAGALRRECLELLANAYKRLDEWTPYEDTLTLLLRECPGNLHAALELAKHHEHRTRNLARAEAVCTTAREHLAREHHRHGLHAEELDALDKRLARIQTKRAKGGGLV